MTTIHAARALLPDGWAENVQLQIGSDGRIAELSPNADRRQGVLVDLLLPAVVNLHSHAFQRAMAGLTEQRGPMQEDSFWTWRERMFHFLQRLGPEEVEAIAALVQMEMLESGYACNVEFHYLHHQSDGRPYDNPAEMASRIAAAAEISGIGLTLLPVHYQYGGCDQRALGPGQARFGTTLAEYEQLWQASGQCLRHLPDDTGIGVAPHSLRAVARNSLQPLMQISPGTPFHMHLAEQLAEVEQVQAAWGARPVEWLLDNAEVDQRWCLIHCTRMLEHETTALARTCAVAGLCPVTESSLGDGIFDGKDFLAQQGRIGIGSDSNIRISLCEEIRTLEYSQRLRDHSRAALASSAQSTGRRLFDAVLQGGAQAAGRECGSIAVGQWADLMALDGSHADLDGLAGDTQLDTWLFAGNDELVSDVWSAGRHQVRQGRHIHRDRIVERYRQLIHRLRQG